jgi:hypothetical protein
MVLGALELGCSSSFSASAKQTLHAYSVAIVRDDAMGAYKLLSPSVRSEISPAEFSKQWRENRRELLEQAKQVDGAVRGNKDELHFRASVEFRQTTPVSLVADDRPLGVVWRLTRAEFGLGAAKTPVEAIQLLLGGIEQRDYAGLLRLLATDQRLLLEAHIQERTDKLRAALLKPNFVFSGDRATIQYDPRFFVELRKEGENWRIVDLN